jgi:hypothetical protein
MPEINNALALGVKSEPVDMIGTLAKAQALKQSQAQTNILEQSYGEREREYGENGGLTSGQRATMSKTQQEAMGPIGNILSNDQSLPARQQALSLAKRAGIPMDTMTEQHLLTAPADQIKQYGVNAQRLGQASTTNIEQSGVPAGRHAAAVAPYTPVQVPPGSTVTTTEQVANAARPPVKSSAAIMGDDEAVRKGLYSPTPDQTKRGVAGPVVSGGEIPGISGIGPKAQAEQTVAGDVLGKEYAGYKEQAISAATTKYLLKNLQDDTARLATGKGATAASVAKQWIQAAGDLPGVGPAIKKIAGDHSDAVAAFEAVQKNAGQLTRATLKDVDGKAASEYSMIQKQLPNVEMSKGGLALVTAQMAAPEDYKQARLQAADSWRKNHRDSIDGFAAEWTKNIGPGAFLFARLPQEEQTAMVGRLNKTPEGQRTLQSLKTQMKWAHDRGLDSVID